MYIVETSEPGTYTDSIDTTELVSRQEYLKCLTIRSASKDTSKNTRGFVRCAMSEVRTKSGGWFSSPCKVRVLRHILVLDCDSGLDLVSAAKSLERRKIKHITAESSPGKYWVFADMIGDFGVIRDELLMTPGVDEQFKRKCADRGSITLRAYYTHERKPNFDLSQIDEFKSNLVKSWILDLYDLYNSPELANIAYNLAISNARSDGNLHEVLADPTILS